MSLYAKNVQVGDLIVVAYSNRMEPAIYLGVGSVRNPNFLLLPASDQHAWRLKRLEQIKDGKRLYKDYVNRSSDTSIAKIDEMSVSDYIRAKYNEGLQILKDKGYLK